MEVSSRQIVALVAPVVVAYLTWSAVSGSPPQRQAEATSVATAAAAKRPVIAKLTRDLFAQDGASMQGGAAAAPGRPGSSLRLNGTVVAGRWRMAIIDGARFFEGQSIRGYRIQAIGRDRVTLEGADGQTVVLALDIAEPPPLATLVRAKPDTKNTAVGAESGEKRDSGPAKQPVAAPSQLVSRDADKVTAKQPGEAKQGGVP